MIDNTLRYKIHITIVIQQEKMYVFMKYIIVEQKFHKNLVYPLYFVRVLCYTMDCKIKRLQNKVGVKQWLQFKIQF